MYMAVKVAYCTTSYQPERPEKSGKAAIEIV
jgi:hypothetical protein